jgi:DNA phosphorothioation-dependent restriction protein DptG
MNIDVDPVQAESMRSLATSLTSIIDEGSIPTLEQLERGFDQAYRPVAGFWNRLPLQTLVKLLCVASPNMLRALNSSMHVDEREFVAQLASSLCERQVCESFAEQFLLAPAPRGSLTPPSTRRRRQLSEVGWSAVLRAETPFSRAALHIARLRQASHASN